MVTIGILYALTCNYRKIAIMDKYHKLDKETIIKALEKRNPNLRKDY